MLIVYEKIYVESDVIKDELIAMSISTSASNTLLNPEIEPETPCLATTRPSKQYLQNTLKEYDLT